MDKLQILLLGSPEVLWQGETLKITRRASRAILYYLALAGRVSRGDLRTLFWPDVEDDNKARANLRVALARLRASLPDPDMLDTDNDTIVLDRSRVSVDAQQFEELAGPALRAAGLAALENPLPDWLAQSLLQAAHLWRAPRLLSGFFFADDNPELDHWQLSISQPLEGLYLQVLVRLADHFMAEGDFESALAQLREGLQVDPWAEELHTRVLHGLRAQGRGAAAAAHADAVLKLFAHENLKVSGMLKALILQVRQGGEESMPPERNGWLVAHLPASALVDRPGLITSLQTFFRRGGLVVVSGEAGIGKTLFAYEFYRSLQPRPRLLLLNCMIGENTLPFQALSDALRRTILPDEWQRLGPVWLRYLVYLLPELAGTQPQAALDREVLSQARGSIFEALRQLLLGISRSGRLLVVLDGAQWCDEATLAALAYLTERYLFRDRGMLLVLARPEEPNLALERWLSGLEGAADFQRISLPAFVLAKTTDLAQRVLGRPVAPEVAQRLLEDTGGNPLFLREMLFGLLENMPAVGLDGALAQLPLGSSLSQVLRQRLARLQPAARQVAAAASVLRAEFTADLLVEVAQLDHGTVIRALDELLQVRLIQPAPGQPEAAYVFVHGLIREVIRREQGGASLGWLHLRAAQARAAQDGGSGRLAARVAHHFEQAGELLRAFEYWLRACRYARGVFAIHEVQQAFQAAERLVPELKGQLSDETLYDLYSILSEISVYDFSNTPFKQEVYTRMLQLGEERQSPLLIGGALSELAYLNSFKTDLDQTLDTFRRAAYHLEGLADPAPAARNEYLQGWFLMRKARYVDARPLLEKALQRLENLPEEAQPELRVNLAYRLGMLYLITGWPQKAEDLAGSALHRGQSLGAVYGHLVLAGARYYLGKRPAARENVRLGMQLAAALGSWRMIGLLYVFQLRLELACGELDMVWEHAQAAAELAEQHHMPDVLCAARTAQGDVYRQLGDLSSAMRAYEEALQVGRGGWDSLSARNRLGLALADAGDISEALRQVEETLAEARRIGLGEVYMPTFAMRALLLVRAGRYDEALQAVPEMVRAAQERGFYMQNMTRITVLIHDAIRREEEDEARRLVGEILTTMPTLMDPFWELTFYRLRVSLGPLEKAEAARVQELLDLLANRTREPELRALRDAYLRRNRAALLGDLRDGS